MKKIISQIPNAITCLNLLSGCVATIMALNGYEMVGGLPGWQWTCIFIGAAAVFDFCDGASARLLRAYSNIGAELDSLSDLVSFGVAPAMMIFTIISHYAAAPWLAYAALIVPVCGALRLARFNVMDVGTTTFRGLPIPSAAIFLIGLAGWVASYGYPSTAVMVILTALPAIAMVCRFEMFSLKFHNFAIHDNLRRYVIIAAAIVFVIIYGLSGLAWTIILYVLMSWMTPRRDA